MKDQCFSPEDLDNLLDMKPEDPKRIHLEDCSACRSLLASYRAFLNPGALPANARAERAHDALADFISQRIEGECVGGETDPGRPSFLQGLVGALRGPVLGPVLALTVVLVAVSVLWLSRDALSPERLNGVVRDLPVDGIEELVARSGLQEGRVLFAWRALPAADAYRIQILSADLVLEREIDTQGELSLEIEVPTDGGSRFWRVIASRNGDEIARSSLLMHP